MEDSIYLGEIPIMIGGGEFIINGAERVIVNQLHRSPGVDFLVEVQEGDRPLHGCRVIPERGIVDRVLGHQEGRAGRPHRPVAARSPRRRSCGRWTRSTARPKSIIQRVLHGRERQGRASSRPTYYAVGADHRRRERRRAGQGRRADRRGAEQDPGVGPEERRGRHEGQRPADPQHARRRHRRRATRTR